ncbi:unnamed protein product [Spirodela intermedia]|uniref:Uncharacterized protein n=1 Tax=Spirodela intermedia TaxID=51605 RepID=A0A7I8J1V3_SPIIN|nr:unnamed protein product [Spirodela intermedia]CAA6663942.1 unnamed protein product [Spirodela intermedia]
MAEENRQLAAQYGLDAKWDACLDLSLRRFVYSTAAGAFGGLLLFPFGAGIGLGSAYTECSYIFEGSAGKESPSSPPREKEGSP